MALPREWVVLDKRGRMTIPKRLLEALGLDRDKSPNMPLLIEAYPDLENTTCLFIKKGY